MMKILFLIVVLSILIGIIPDSFSQTENVNATEEQKISTIEHKDLTTKLEGIESSTIKQEDFQDNVDNLQLKLNSVLKNTIDRINILDNKNTNQYRLGTTVGTAGVVMSLIIAGLAIKKSDSDNKKIKKIHGNK